MKQITPHDLSGKAVDSQGVGYRDYVDAAEQQYGYSRESRLAQVDEFNLAKLFPGRINSHYVVNGHPINVATRIMHQHQIRQMTPASYTVIFYFPTMVVHNALRKSGLYITNTNSELTTYNTAQLLLNSESYATTYGGDFISFSDGGYVWSSSMEICPKMPEATVSGQTIIGHVQYKQLAVGLTLQQLIRLGRVHDTHESVSLNVAINNDAMIYDDSDNLTKYTTETIAYCILSTPSRSIQNDVNLQFQLALSFKLNYVFWTDANNIFAYALTSQSSEEQTIEKLKPQQVPSLPSGLIPSFSEINRKDPSGEGLWKKLQPLLYSGAKGGYKAAKFLAPYLLPAGGFMSTAMTLADPFMKADLEEPTYDYDQNRFMYEQCLKNYHWTDEPPNADDADLWRSIKVQLEHLRDLSPPVSTNLQELTECTSRPITPNRMDITATFKKLLVK